MLARLERALSAYEDAYGDVAALAAEQRRMHFRAQFLHR
jgi:hypothetical protein